MRDCLKERKMGRTALVASPQERGHAGNGDLGLQVGKALQVYTSVDRAKTFTDIRDQERLAEKSGHE